MFVLNCALCVIAKNEVNRVVHQEIGADLLLNGYINVDEI
jgi:hypothetical protein